MRDCSKKCPLKVSRHNDDYTLGYCDGYEQGKADTIKECYEKAKNFDGRTGTPIFRKNNGKSYRMYCMLALEYLSKVAHELMEQKIKL